MVTRGFASVRPFAIFIISQPNRELSVLMKWKKWLLGLYLRICKQHLVYIFGDLIVRTGKRKIMWVSMRFWTRFWEWERHVTYLCDIMLIRKQLSLCKTTGLQILNRRSTETEYTCYRPNGASVIDYLLAPWKPHRNCVNLPRAWLRYKLWPLFIAIPIFYD